VYVHDGYKRMNKKIDSHTTKNLTSLLALGSILKDFLREPMSVDVRVILLVEDNKTLDIPV
jgi:hypothetical protein